MRITYLYKFLDKKLTLYSSVDVENQILKVS